MKTKHLLCLILPAFLLLSGFTNSVSMQEENSESAAGGKPAETSVSAVETGSESTVSNGNDSSFEESEKSYRTIFLDGSLTGPPQVKEVWYAAHRSADGRKRTGDVAGEMTREEPVTRGQNTWTCVFAAELPDGYDEIRFSDHELKNTAAEKRDGRTTGLLTIPKDLKKPCYYADADDPSVYDKEERNGCWKEAFEIRDPEEEYDEKLLSDAGTGISEGGLVKIPESGEETGQNTLCVGADLYDYYTDFELNGIPRSDFENTDKSNRTWVPFRNLDEALSDEYQINGGIPLYVGHFQPDVFEELRFSEIAPLLDLKGWEDPNGFFATNNSTLDASGNGSAENRKYEYASQGLIGKSLKNGLPVCAKPKGSGDTDSTLPLFSEKFLEGENSRNIKLGKIYRDAAFPFHQVDRDRDGILYWSFDSAADHVHLSSRREPDESGFRWYLGDYAAPVEEGGDPYAWSKNRTSAGEPDPKAVSDEYGFFPLNSPETDENGFHYNYGFGMSLAFDFNLPEGSVLRDKNGNDKPVVFTFSGDDDLWVFLDGKLVLDVGGDHGKAEGMINFADRTVSVSKVKKSQGNRDAVEGPQSSAFEMDDNGGKHRLAVFYLERGMWESNLKLQFNLAPEKAEGTENIELPYTGEDGMQAVWLMTGTAVFLFSLTWLTVTREKYAA